MRSRFARVWVTAAILGLAGMAASAWIDPAALMVSWLAVAVTVASLAVGSMAVLMLTYLVRGPWTQMLHVPLTAAALTTPVAAALFLPALLSIPWLYPWATGHAGTPDSFKDVYLVPWLFILRTSLGFIVWTGLSLWLRRAWANPRRMIVSASAGIVVYALTGSLAGIDWLESLTPDFHSSLYGLMFVTFQLLAGLSIALVVSLAAPGRETFRAGAILLSALLMWAYNHAMQYIIVWSANIPGEAAWYTHRLAHGWGIALWGLIGLQFVVPFFALLLPNVREGRRPLLVLAAATVMLRFLEAILLAAPGTSGDSATLLVAAPAAAVTALAIWSMAFRLVRDRLQTCAHDTRLMAGGFDAAGSPAPSAPQRS